MEINRNVNILCSDCKILIQSFTSVLIILKMAKLEKRIVCVALTNCNVALLHCNLTKLINALSGRTVDLLVIPLV